MRPNLQVVQNQSVPEQANLKFCTPLSEIYWDDQIIKELIRERDKAWVIFRFLKQMFLCIAFFSMGFVTGFFTKPVYGWLTSKKLPIREPAGKISCPELSEVKLYIKK